MKAAIYARVSTDRQENKNQLEQLREFAKKQDWDIVREFVDTVSGSGKQSRPAFDQMMLWASNASLTFCCSGSWIASRAKECARRSSISPGSITMALVGVLIPSSSWIRLAFSRTQSFQS